MTIHQIPNTLKPRCVLDAVHGQPAVQGRAAPDRLRRRHALHDGRRPQGDRRLGRTVVHQRRPRPARDRRRGFAAADAAGLCAVVPDRPSDRVRLRREAGGDRAARTGPRLLHQFRFRVGRHGAQDRAGLPSRCRPADAHPPDRPRARLSWRRFRRHVGRRHGEQPQGVRDASARRRSSAPHPRSRPQRLLQGSACARRRARR